MDGKIISPLPLKTEDDLVRYLQETPDFFERYSTVLAHVRLSNPHGAQAASLLERQVDVLREKIKSLESQVNEMIHHSTENAAIMDRLQLWAMHLLRIDAADELPARIIEDMHQLFGVPQVAIKVWGVAPQYKPLPFARGVSEDVKTFSSSLTVPFCGNNPGFEVVQWLPNPHSVASLALLPLRVGTIHNPTPAFGLLVLASFDETRFQSGMGTDFLERIAEIASAALMRLR